MISETYIKLKNIKINVFLTIIIFILLIFANFTLILNVKASDHSSNEEKLSFSIDLTFEEPTFSDSFIDNKIFTNIEMNNCHLTTNIGHPSLPFYPVKFLVPYGYNVENIDVDHSQQSVISCDLISKPISPVQNEYITSSDGDEVSFIMNEDVYNSNTPVNSFIFTNENIDFCRGFAVLSVNLYPTVYIPKTGDLSFYSEMSVSIDFCKGSVFSSSGVEYDSSLLRMKQGDIDVISSIVVNPEMVNSYPTPVSNTNDFSIMGGEDSTVSLPCNPSYSYDYIIVTNNDLKDTSGYPYEWSDLISHRQSLDGLSGVIVTIEEIDACSAYQSSNPIFDDSAAHLREFVKDAYQNWGLEYILLGGTWETSNSNRQIVPCRIFTVNNLGAYYDTMASDLYFSNLDGDWYESTTSVWGGGKNGENDKLSEVAVGRFPVWDAAMVSNAVQKVIWYDNCNDEDWLKSCGFLGGDLHWDVTSKEYMEELRIGDGAWGDGNVGFEEWNTVHPSYALDTSGRYYEADYPSESDAVNAWKSAINNNELCLISHVDHGSRTNTMSMGTGSSLSNSHFFLGASHACMSGRYHGGSSGASTFTSSWDDRGAYAVILNTGYGYGSASSTYGSSHYQLKMWWDYYFGVAQTNFDIWRLGDAMKHTKDRFSAFTDQSTTRCYVWYSWNLFADPAQQIRIGQSGPVNNPPYKPYNPSPNDKSSNVPISTLLSWSGGDPDQGDTVVYDVFFGTDSTPDNSELVSSGQTGTYYNPPVDLNYLTKYYWQIVAHDNHGNEKQGDVWDFITIDEPINNNPPYKPNYLAPANGGSNQDVNVDLAWSGGDPDTGDRVTYDVYLGTSNNPPRVKIDHRFSTFDPGVLEEDTKYYWQIVARDSYGDTTTGDTWSFTTAQGQTGIDISITTFNNGDFTFNLKNDGQDTQYDVEWDISITGAIFGRIDISDSGIIGSINSQESKELSIDYNEIGLDFLNIKISATINGIEYNKEAIGLILGRSILVF